MALWSRCPINAPDAARHVRVRVERESEHVLAARGRAEWSRCSKWDLACTSRCRRTAILVRARGRPSLREVNARPVSAGRQ